MGTQIQGEPKPPFPEQKLPKPGLERDLEPKPEFEAPRYRAAGKLERKVALVTGGDCRAVLAEGRRCVTIEGDLTDEA
jgi:hypothetical protein